MLTHKYRPLILSLLVVIVSTPVDLIWADSAVSCREIFKAEADGSRSESIRTKNGVEISITQKNVKGGAQNQDARAQIEIIRDVIRRINPILNLKEPVTIEPYSMGLSGAFSYFKVVSGPVRVGMEKLPFPSLNVQDSSTIMIHELGHLQFDHRFFDDRRLNYKIPKFFEVIRGRQEVDFLRANSPAFSQSPEQKDQVTRAFTRWRQAQDDFERITNRRPDDRAEADPYHGAHSAAIAFHARFLSFTEMYANLFARLFEVTSGSSDRFLDHAAKASAYIDHEDLLGWNGKRGSKRVPQTAVDEAINRVRLEKGFSEVVDPTEWEQRLRNLAVHGRFKGLYGEDVGFLSTQLFKELVLAPFRGWMGKNVLPKVKTDNDRLRVLDTTYESIIATFDKMESLSYIKIDEVAVLNQIMIDEFQSRWNRQ